MNFVFLLLSIELFGIYCDAEVSHSSKHEADKSDPTKISSNQKDDLNVVDSFQKEYPLLLKIKRREQDVAINLILTKSRDEKQMMLKHLFFRIYETIKESKQVLIKFNDNIDDFKMFSTTEESREHFARIIENTIFLAGLTLYFPKFALYYINKESDFIQLYQWSINFCSNLTFLDNETKGFINLASQEMDFIPKKEDFINPFKDTSMMTDSSSKKEELQREALREMKEREMAKKLAKSNKPKKKNKTIENSSKTEL